MLSRQFHQRICTQFFSRISNRSISSLVVAEHNDKELTSGTLSTITAATKIGGDITLLLLGSKAETIASSAAKVPGVTKVLHATDVKYDHYLAEVVTDLLVATQESGKYTHILAPSSNASKNYLPRLGAKLDIAPISEVAEIQSEDTFIRPTYAGNAIAQVKSNDAVKIMTIRATNFDKVSTEGSTTAEIMAAPSPPETETLSTFVSEEVSKSERPDLSAAKVVVSGGRGLKSGENFEMLYKLADKCSPGNAAVGASRAAVDAGYVPNELQVGQTGKVVAPELYIAVGISGAIQHLAGMKDSKTIVAINKDEDAPIFQVADYGLVADLFEAVPELTEKI